MYVVLRIIVLSSLSSLHFHYKKNLHSDCRCMGTCMIRTGPQKNWHNFFYQILTDFQNYFTTRIKRKLVIMLPLKSPPHVTCVATLSCEMLSVLKTTFENKTTSLSSVSTHFKKLITGNNVFIVSVIVQSNCQILQFLYQMFNVSTSSTLLLENALKRTTPLTYGVINDADISQGSVATHDVWWDL